jgi:hypothetical protein
MTADVQRQIAAAKANTAPSRNAAPTSKGKAHPAIVSELVGQEIVFPGKVPGNNGPGGLLRLHWREKLELQNTYSRRVWAARLRRSAGPVRLELVRYSTGRHMDYDNLVSTGKLLIDAIVRCGILPDDNPTIIAERSYTQERAESKEAQRTVIRLIPL